MRLHIRMNTQLVDLQIRPSDKRLVASDHITLELLINLMMTLNMQLKTSLRRVLLATPRVGTREHIGAARVDLLVLLEMLHVEEGLAAVRHRTDEIAGSMGIVCSHVNVQIAAPIKYFIATDDRTSIRMRAKNHPEFWNATWRNQFQGEPA